MYSDLKLEGLGSNLGFATTKHVNLAKTLKGSFDLLKG